MKRQDFIKTGLLGMSGLWLSKQGYAKNSNPPDQIKISVIKEFVQAGHNDLNRVKEMLEHSPSLLYCRYDWGGGDFEEAIEGAGHVGNKEIARYLIDQGARVNLFVLTMLGKTNLVKPVLDEYPELIFAHGPHGFTLLHHANVGGVDAVELGEYLKNKGLKKTKVRI